MKKSILFSLFLLAGIAGANAQIESETITVKAVKKGEEPKAVMDAIKQDFPKTIIADLNILPGKLYGEQWSISVDDKLHGASPDNYLVTLKEKNETFRAVYDKTGQLRSSKHIIEQTQLPGEVTSAIAAKYPDWTIVKDSEKITYKEGKTKEAYKVEIQKDKTRRNLFLSNSGSIVKDIALRHAK